MMLKYFYMIIFIFVILSCDKQSRKIEYLLITGKSIVEQNPDSTLILLDSIQYPEDLDEKLFAEYNLLLVQAKDKAYKNILEDTLIFQAQAYFERNNDNEKTVLSYFYSGRVYQTRKEIGKALIAFLKAESYAERIDDNNLKGMIQFFIGRLNFRQSLHYEAITRYKLANHYFLQSQSENKFKNEIATFNSLGNSFLLINQVDSAFSYYERGLALAVQEQDSIVQADILQNIGVAYSEIHNFSQAKTSLLKALRCSPDSKQKAKIYYNLAECYHNINKKDSSAYFVNQSLQLLEKGKDTPLSANIYRLLSNMEKQDKDYLKALEYYQKYTQSLKLILKEKEDFAILDVQRKFDFERLQNKNNRLMVEKQWMGIISIFFFLGVVSIMIYYKNKNKRNKESKCEAEQKIEQLNEMIEMAESDDQQSIRGIVVQYFNVLKKAALLEKCLSEDQKKGGERVLKEFNKVLYEKENGFDWNILYQTMNTLSKGKLDTLQGKFPQLDEVEFKICCLVISGFNNSEISLLLNLNLNVVQIKKTRIRKKIGTKNIESMLYSSNENSI